MVSVCFKPVLLPDPSVKSVILELGHECGGAYQAFGTGAGMVLMST
jgi:hypothetical protein